MTAGAARNLSEVRQEAVRAGLASPSTADPLVRLAAVPAALVAGHAIAVRSDAWYVTLLLIISLGFVYLSLPAIAHEALHGHISRRPWANRCVGVVASATALVPYSMFRYFHLEHHAHTATTGDSEEYPSTFTRRQFLVFPYKQLTFTILLWRWTYQVARGRGPSWVRSKRQSTHVVIDAVATLAIALAFLGTALAIGRDALVVWPAPLVVAAVLYSYTVMPEHFGARHRVEPTPDRLSSTASVRSNRFLRVIVWNSNYHAAHHFMATVPARNLPALDELISDAQPVEWRHRGYVSWYLTTLNTLDTNPMNAPLTSTLGPAREKP